MDRRIEALRGWGCDVESAMERMLGDEEFYIECLTDVLDDPNFRTLNNALDRRETGVAFDSAHTLKGVLINLGLTPMYNAVVEIVEPLRAGRINGLQQKCEELERQRQRLAQILRMA